MTYPFPEPAVLDAEVFTELPSTQIWVPEGRENSIIRT